MTVFEYNQTDLSFPRDGRGLVFDIKEFALFDGPGLRCTVFMKGCPLGCSWCHNPEGQAFRPEVMRTAAGERTVGVFYRPEELADKLLGYQEVLKLAAGGVTFSGGEPLWQGDFVAEVMRRLTGRLHLLLQTSGYAPSALFRQVSDLSDLVYFDLKLVDPVLHRRYTGQDNALILENLRRLDRSGRPYRLRVPLIPGLTDSRENYQNLRDLLAGELNQTDGLQGLDFLPYNPATGGKYPALGRVFQPGYDETRPLDLAVDFFREVVKEVKVL
ncbi:MAG: radical SAM protein [Planctomycetota bacterium]|nr:radical SAM protein [Planctomycetota bacterium]